MLKKILFSLLTIILLLVVFFLYASYFRKDLILSKEYVKEKYSLPNSKFINWEGSEIHYTESGSGFPILMIHGFGGSNYDFKTLDSLINNQYRIIRVDLPGFGLSDFPKQTASHPDYIKIYNDYFNFLLDTLHIDSCYVMGNSLGGMMSWNLAISHPNLVKKLVLFNSAGYDMKEVEKTARVTTFKNPIVKMLLHRGLPMFLTKNGMSRVFYNKSVLTPERAQRMNDFWNREGNLQQILNMASSGNYIDQNLIKNVKCPTLIIWGKEDKVINPKFAERFHRDIKNSKVIMYNECGHVPMMENSLQVKQDVLNFLEKN